MGTGEPLRENEKGEVLVRGPQIMKGRHASPCHFVYSVWKWDTQRGETR